MLTWVMSPLLQCCVDAVIKIPVILQLAKAHAARAVRDSSGGQYTATVWKHSYASVSWTLSIFV